MKNSKFTIMFVHSKTASLTLHGVYNTEDEAYEAGHLKFGQSYSWSVQPIQED